MHEISFSFCLDFSVKATQKNLSYFFFPPFEKEEPTKTVTSVTTYKERYFFNSIRCQFQCQLLSEIWLQKPGSQEKKWNCEPLQARYTEDIQIYRRALTSFCCYTDHSLPFSILKYQNILWCPRLFFHGIYIKGNWNKQLPPMLFYKLLFRIVIQYFLTQLRLRSANSSVFHLLIISLYKIQYTVPYA